MAPDVSLEEMCNHALTASVVVRSPSYGEDHGSERLCPDVWLVYAASVVLNLSNEAVARSG